mmetsp:Transcript_28331/g.71934  ORF Transcript_28331/g.71934 Transcript_28331/m.71934 type:complete len:507 (-) Transcript_28331:842-2362(-)|eukprot:CAMPEP_0178985216 /NCGR_PEP_ID=MMETSP0795-20121207/2030_1 /TAXON_ID=88552 /ORGANISM="Amoebophrya sp., Strain Ameob2" /LENGTH=506 /DNA_ID=CAMNT_0020676151 /DNA_START=212 /DNA_END=1732 /DNA_ORIENTATION=+
MSAEGAAAAAPAAEDAPAAPAAPVAEEDATKLEDIELSPAAAPAAPAPAAGTTQAASSSSSGLSQTAEHPKIFIAVNPSSGNKKGADYMKAGKEIADGVREVELDVAVDAAKKVTIYIFNIKHGAPADKPGFHMLKKCVDASTDPTRCVVAGGDGTVTWAFEELDAHGVTMGKVVVGVVPFGTGNDFSRSYNWGKSSPWSVVGKDNSVLKKNAAQWLAAKTSPHDIWQIEMETQKGGGFVYVTGYNEKGLNDGLKKQHRIVDLPGGGMKSTKTMCNYFSIGAESRVGMGMERRRKATWAGNQLMYCASGASALCCKSTPKMKDVVENAVEHLPADPSDPSGKTRVVFHTDPADKTSAPYLRRSPCTLCLINTDTMAAGQRIWDRTSSINATKGDHTQNSVLAEGKHQMGDGKLNLMTWRNLLQFSLDIVCGQIGCTSACCNLRGSNRLASLENPLSVNFKDKDKAKYIKEGRMYFQIDGEYFICQYPKKVYVKHREKINVLDNRTS